MGGHGATAGCLTSTCLVASPGGLVSGCLRLCLVLFSSIRRDAHAGRALVDAAEKASRKKKSQVDHCCDRRSLRQVRRPLGTKATGARPYRFRTPGPDGRGRHPLELDGGCGEERWAIRTAESDFLPSLWSASWPNNNNNNNLLSKRDRLEKQESNP